MCLTGTCGKIDVLLNMEERVSVALKSNTLKIGGGGILRNDYGNIIYVFSNPFGEGSNNQAKVQAATYGLYRCIQHGFRNIILEVDSELLTKWLLQKD